MPPVSPIKDTTRQGETLLDKEDNFELHFRAVTLDNVQKITLKDEITSTYHESYGDWPIML